MQIIMVFFVVTLFLKNTQMRKIKKNKNIFLFSKYFYLANVYDMGAGA